MDNILSPSLLSADFGRLGEEIRTIDENGAQYVHVDVMDGIFVKSISYGMPVIKSIRKETKKTFDVHLMITEPIRYIEEFTEAGADIITVHVEACKNVGDTLKIIKSHGVKASLALNPSTDLREVEPYIEMCDMMLVMSVNPGFGGQKFIESSVSKTERLRKMCDIIKPEMDIEIDGGINKDNLITVLNAGANVIVAGSSIFRGDAGANIKEFLEIMK